MPQLVFNLQFDTCSVRLLVCLSSDLFLIAVIERYIRKRFSESSLNFWSRQEKTLEILVLSKYLFIRIFFHSSVMHMTTVYASVRGEFLTSAISEVEIFLSQRALSQLSKGFFMLFCSVVSCQTAFSGIKAASSEKIKAAYLGILQVYAYVSHNLVLSTR